MRKIYVDMTAEFDESGNVYPRRFRFEDGNMYEIDKVTDIRRRASMKAGGLGIRYTCRIKNAVRYIYFDENRWFIESEK